MYASISVFRQCSYSKVNGSIRKGSWVSPQMQPKAKGGFSEHWGTRKHLQNTPELSTQSLQATRALWFQISKQLPSRNRPKEAKQDDVPIRLNLRSPNTTYWLYNQICWLSDSGEMEAGACYQVEETRRSLWKPLPAALGLRSHPASACSNGTAGTAEPALKKHQRRINPLQFRTTQKPASAQAIQGAAEKQKRERRERLGLLRMDI